MDDDGSSAQTSASMWTKRCYFAGRELMDTTLRKYDLGSTQWYVIQWLADDGPTAQRDLVRTLNIERATLSAIVATLVRKGLISQTADSADQRQRSLRLTTSGEALWSTLPDLRFIQEAAFGEIDQEELAITVRVLRAATKRLQDLQAKGK